jgi:hypothetical protein
MTTKIYITGKTDRKPRREIIVDEFSYTVSTTGGESIVTLPGGRSYDIINDFIRVMANGIKIKSGVEYTKSATTTITAVNCDMFPGGKFPKNCILDFELYSTN